MEDAKQYAMALAGRAGFDIENVVDSTDEKYLEQKKYENTKLKMETILEFGKKYKEIMELVAEYEFPKNTSGGYYIKHALILFLLQRMIYMVKGYHFIRLKELILEPVSSLEMVSISYM